MDKIERGQLLIVDDEEEVLKSMRRLFRKAYSVHVAKNADEGFEILKNNTIHVIISDQRMPVTTGTEFLTKVKRLYPDIVRLILTGYSDIEAVISAINDASIFRYMTKPWSPEKVEAAVEEAFAFHETLKNRNLHLPVFDETIEVEAKFAESTSKILVANAELQQLYEEKEQLIRQLNQKIEELQVAEEKLHIAKKDAEKASRAKSEFLTHMSHELRTPLNGIMGFVQILQNKESYSGHGPEAINTIERCAEHLLGMVDDLLDIARIEANKTDITESDIHLYQFLEYLTESFMMRAKEKQLNFVYEFDENIPDIVRTDEKRLRQILFNILGNAVKFTIEGVIRFKVSYLNGKCVFEISDTGIGIPEEEINNIFLPFYRIKNTEYYTEGAGLGLAITQQLVHLLKGEMTIRSRCGEGTHFRLAFDFPVISSEGHPGLVRKKKKIVGYKGDRIKVLVVDDNVFNRQVLRYILLPLGFEVEEARNGIEAVKKTEEIMPDIIFLDLIMPQMNGYEFASKIRDKHGENKPVIIAVSADITEAARKKSFETGCNDYIPKPITIDIITEKTGNHLSLEWVYEEDNVTGGDKRCPFYPPPPEYLNAFDQMAMIGDIKGIEALAERIKISDSEYAYFGEKIYLLAKKYQIKQIKKIIDQYK